MDNRLNIWSWIIWMRHASPRDSKKLKLLSNYVGGYVKPVTKHICITCRILIRSSTNNKNLQERKCKSTETKIVLNFSDLFVAIQLQQILYYICVFVHFEIRKNQYFQCQPYYSVVTYNRSFPVSFSKCQYCIYIYITYMIRYSNFIRV